MKDFEIPSDLTQESHKIATTISDLLGDEASGGGCRAFYSPEEWKERGEKYGVESLLILVHDGGELAPYCNHDYEDSMKMEMISAALRPLNAYIEQCTSWYSAVYPIMSA